MRTIHATNDLVIELWPSGGAGDKSLLLLRSLAAERDGEEQRVVIYLDEVRHVIGALVDASFELVELSTQHKEE